MYVSRRWHAHGATRGSTQATQMAHVCTTQLAHTWGKLGQHAGGATGACVCHSGGTHMARTEAARRWKVRTYVHTCRRLVQHAGGTNSVRMCVPRWWRRNGRKSGAARKCANGPCVCHAGGTRTGRWGSTAVAQLAHVCSTQVAHTWRKLVRRAGGTYTQGADWGSTPVAEVAQTCATKVAHTWRKVGHHAGGTNCLRTYVYGCATQFTHAWGKLGQHAGVANGACVCRAKGGRHTRVAQWGVRTYVRYTHAPHNWRNTGAARRWRKWLVCVPRKWRSHLAQMAHVCATQVATHIAHTGATRQWYVHAYVPQTGEARKRRKRLMCVPRRWYSRAAN